MSDLHELADAGGPEVVLTQDLPTRGEATVLEKTTYDADDLTPEGDFPQYGQFLRVEVEDEEEYWECAQGLAAAIVEIAKEKEIEIPGCRLAVDRAFRSASGEWRFSVVLSRPAND